MNYATHITTHIYHKSKDKHLVGSLFVQHIPMIIKQDSQIGTANLWYFVYMHACLVSSSARPVVFTLAEQAIIKEAFMPGSCRFDKYGCWVGFNRGVR